MENITKSIIYGNCYQNKYGKFLPVCSSISDRCKVYFYVQPMCSQLLIICIKLLIFENIIELHTHIEFKKHLLFLSLKKKIFRPTIIKIFIVIKLSKARAKNCCIYYKNLVCIISYKTLKMYSLEYCCNNLTRCCRLKPPTIEQLFKIADYC
jgi:hypothetical protein